MLPAIALSLALTALPAPAAIDAEARAVLAKTHANGLAIALIDDGRVGYVQAYGIRDAEKHELTPDTVMYGASLTKTVFAFTVLQLVDQNRLDLDTPIAADLDHPLPDDGPYKDLAGDPRWRKITPRMVLTHSAGFANFAAMEPDKTLRIHFDPGTKYSYSGEGMILLQFAIEHGKTGEGLGLDLGALTQANFDRLGMTRTSLVWRPDFAPNVADGWNDKGKAQPHYQRTKVRVAGSMDTTIADFARFAAALVRGDGLSPTARAEMVKRQLKITTAHQFPNFGPDLPSGQQRKDLYAGLGVVVFDGPQGHGFFKGGHDSGTANTLVCVEEGRRCALVLSNDVRAETAFPELVKFLLGDTGVPYDWEYGDYAGKS